MNIECTECSRNLGEIRDFSLLKGIKIICPACELRISKAKLDKFFSKGKKKSSVFYESFGTFGGK